MSLDSLFISLFISSYFLLSPSSNLLYFLPLLSFPPSHFSVSSPSTCPLICRWDLLRELQSHRAVQALHRVHRPDADEDALHRLQRCHLHLQLQLFLQYDVRPMRTVYGVPGRPGGVCALRTRSRHGVWGVYGRYLLWPGKLPRPLPALHHLWWGNWEAAGCVHTNQWLCLS